jgi:hypothetical protein
MKIHQRRIVIACLTALSSSGLCLLGQTPVSATETNEIYKKNVTWAPQGWNQKTRDFYHFASQGTYLTQSAWFMALEVSNSETLISDPTYLASLGFMTEPKSRANPLGLPVGFAQGRNSGVNMISTANSVGLTCATCHSGQITYRNKTMRFDGLGAMVNVVAFGSAFSGSSSSAHDGFS